MSDVDIKRMARSVERGQGLTANAKKEPMDGNAIESPAERCSSWSDS